MNSDSYHQLARWYGREAMGHMGGNDALISVRSHNSDRQWAVNEPQMLFLTTDVSCQSADDSNSML